MDRKQYWRDFFSAIWDLVKIIFIILLVGCGAVIYMSLVPWWVSICILAVVWIWYWADSKATEKQEERMRIDSDIEYLKEKIRINKECIAVLSELLEKIKEDEDEELQEKYIHEIHHAEMENKKFSQNIERLEFQKSSI
jgi:septal ring factor EnvC (AmiA/AmiB activator)